VTSENNKSETNIILETQSYKCMSQEQGLTV